MQVSRIMTASVESVPPETTIQDVARTMKRSDIGPLPVCEDDRLIGVVTDRDIAIRAVAQGLDPRTTSVREIMSPEVLWCYENQSVDDVAQLMRQRQVRRVIVLDQNRRLCGIASLGDLATQQPDQQLVAETLEQVSEPAG
jgi:CBS domain-containing protein